MLRFSLALAGVCLLTASSGCSMCCAPFDTAFGAYGGAVERGDLHHGRVGSIFDPAGAHTVTYDSHAESEVVEPYSGFEPIEGGMPLDGDSVLQ